MNPSISFILPQKKRKKKKGKKKKKESEKRRTERNNRKKEGGGGNTFFFSGKRGLFFFSHIQIMQFVFYNEEINIVQINILIICSCPMYTTKFIITINSIGAFYYSAVQ
jgi:hypothetical protein